MKFFDVSIPVSLYRFSDREAVLGDQGKPSAPTPASAGRRSIPTSVRTVLPGHRLMALVRYSAEQAAGLIAEVSGARPGLLRDYQVKVLDGNGLDGREHRLRRHAARVPPPCRARH
jgi:hypothetical protein